MKKETTTKRDTQSNSMV